MTRHRRTHPDLDQPGCFGCKIASVSVGISAQVKAMDRSEKALRKDLEAYRTLRKQGLQPEHLRGSAALADHAAHPFAVEHPQVYGRFDDFGKAHVDELLDLSGALTPAREAPESLRVAKDEPK
jgi:hypothetical protein